MSDQNKLLLESTLDAAREKSRRYEWLAAADAYQQVIYGSGENWTLPEKAAASELLAKCQYKAAFQSPNRGEFSRRMRLAQDSYEEAATLYERSGIGPLAKGARSRGLFAAFWLEDESEKRRVIIQKCILLSDETAQIFQRRGDADQLAKTLEDSLAFHRESLLLATEWTPLNEEFEKTLHLGRKVAREFSALGEDEELIEALQNFAWILAVQAQPILQPADFKGLESETTSLVKDLQEIVRGLATPYAQCLANEAAGDVAWDLEGNFSKALDLYLAAVSQAQETGDSLVIGRLLAVLATLQHWRVGSGERTEERQMVIDQGLKFAEQAIEHLKVPLHTGYLALAYSSYASCGIDLADLVDTELEKKRAHLAKAIEMAATGMAYEKGTRMWRGAAHELSKAQYFLAVNTLDATERAKILKEALEVRENALRAVRLLQPNSWNEGVMHNYLALIKAELAGISGGSEASIGLLKEAVADMGRCLSVCEKGSAIPGSAQLLARYSEWFGDILSRLYSHSTKPETAKEAIGAYNRALLYAAKAGNQGAIAPLNWKIGRVQDTLSEFSAASEAFRTASKSYRSVGAKMPGIGPAFEELANYMEAFSTIEEARLHHAEEDFSSAQDKYAKVAKILEAHQPWSHLGQLCAARSVLEHAEALSAEEKHTASVESFGKAAAEFRQARTDIERRLASTTDPRDQEELWDMLSVSTQREAYCTGRIDLEQARALDRRGEKHESARRYRSASEIFKTLLNQIRSSQDRGELKTLAGFCSAWAKMKEAEAKVSPELYAEAAETFREISDTSTREQFRLVALADASVCRALEAGTRFRLTRDARLYSETKKHLQVAADQYRQAGLRKTESWTRGTQRLFDALVYLSDAEVERDPKKKTDLYHLTEKHLELAAKLYGEAGFPRMKEEALEHLVRVREEKQVLLAPLEMLSEIPTRSGVSLTTVNLRGASPSGPERFEAAYVVGDMHISQRILPVDSGVTLELDMANVGRSPATLVKLQDIAPAGLEFDRQRTPYSIEGGQIDLAGKRLDHLKTHQVKVTLKTHEKGVFEFRPRLFFVDDKGNYKSYQFPAASVTVMELGTTVPSPLSVAVAPPKTALPVEFSFETERAKEVFQCLVKEFLRDYMSKRIYVEMAGWRTLMDLIGDLKIPRSALYGPEGRTGPVLVELERRGLVEARIFPKERGRGGAIKKVRVAYDNAIVKKILEQSVLEDK